MARGRAYSLEIPALASITAVPFAQIAPPSTCGVEILAIEVGQEGSTTSAENALYICKRSTASTLPTTATPAKLNDNDPASLLTGSTTTNAVGLSTVTGTLVSTIRLPGNMLNGWLWVPTSDYTLKIKPGGFLTLSFAATVAALTISGQIYFAELD